MPLCPANPMLTPEHVLAVKKSKNLLSLIGGADQLRKISSRSEVELWDISGYYGSIRFLS